MSALAIETTIKEGDRVRYSRAWYLELCKKVGRKVSRPHCGAADAFEIQGTVGRILLPGQNDVPVALVTWDGSHEECHTLLDGRVERVERLDEWIVTYTTAPEAYDFFGTRTVAVVGASSNGTPVRKVESNPRYAEDQRARYRSGLHLAVDTKEWVALVNANLVTTTWE